MLGGQGYMPLWERYPHLFPSGDPRVNGIGATPQQPSPMEGVGGQLMSVGGTLGGKYIGSNLGSVVGSSIKGASASSGAATGASAATTSGVAVAPTSSLGSIASVALPIAATIGAGWAAQDVIKDSEGKSPKQAALDAAKTPQGWIAGGGIGGPILAAASTYWGSGKNRDQMARDNMRKDFQRAGFVDDNFAVTLADGSKFDIGADGSKFGQMANINWNDEGEAKNKGDAVGLVQGLVQMTGQGKDKAKEQMTGYLANAVTSSGDPIANARKMYEEAGYNKQKAYDDTVTLLRQGKITDDEARAYQNAYNQIFSDQELRPAGGFSGIGGKFNPWSYFGMESAPTLGGIGGMTSAVMKR